MFAQINGRSIAGSAGDVFDYIWRYRSLHGPVSWTVSRTGTGREEIQRTAYDDAYRLSVEAAGCAAEDVNYAVAETAAAVVVQALLDPSDLDLLVAPWTALFGQRTGSAVTESPPVWPPAMVYEPSCGRPCIHGAAEDQRNQSVPG